MKIKVYLIIFTFIFQSCGLTTARPKLEMSLAQAAFIAAKNAKSDEHSPQFYRKAEVYYLKARSAYRRKYFNKAKSYAELSRKFSEKAEFATIKKIQFEDSE